MFSLSFKDHLGDIMASKRDLRSYFVTTDNTNKEISSSIQKVSLIIQSSPDITGETEIQYIGQESKKQVAKPAKHYNNIPSKINQEIGSYALIHGTKAAIDRFSKVYTKCSLKRTTVNEWKESCKKNYLHSIGKTIRPNLADDVIIGSRLADTVIFRKMVDAIGTSVAKANEPKTLRGFGGSLQLTKDWAQNFLKGMY